jgi:squalene-associated FAD-dependent desaturase
MHTDVLIIGGGIAGLACGFALSDAGLAVTLLESSDTLGGRARSWQDQATGDTVDIGPHILLSEYHNMLRLLELLGTREQVVWQQDKFITLVDRPRPVPIRMHRLPAPLHFLPSMLGAPQVSLSDMASNRRLIWFVLRMQDADVLRLDDVPADDFLRRMGVSERFIDWFWRSAAMAIMNVPLERCSTGALLHFFRYMIGKSGYRVGFAAGGLADLFAPPAARRIEAAGGRVVLRTEVAALTVTDGAVSAVRLADGSDIAARYCVAAVPPQQLLPLLPAAWREHRVFAQLAGVEPSPYISTYLWFDRKLTGERFWTRVWSPTNLNYDFYDLSNIRAGWQERPSLIASNVIFSGRVEDLSDGDIIAATVDELAAFAPDAKRATVRHARVHRIPMAIPAPFPGSEQRRPDTRSPIEGLLLAGDWVRTGLPASMEGATRAGLLAAEQTLAALGRRRQLASPPPEVGAAARAAGSLERLSRRRSSGSPP